MSRQPILDQSITRAIRAIRPPIRTTARRADFRTALRAAVAFPIPAGPRDHPDMEAASRIPPASPAPAHTRQGLEERQHIPSHSVAPMRIRADLAAAPRRAGSAAAQMHRIRDSVVERMSSTRRRWAHRICNARQVAADLDSLGESPVRSSSRRYSGRRSGLTTSRTTDEAHLWRHRK